MADYPNQITNKDSLGRGSDGVEIFLVGGISDTDTELQIDNGNLVENTGVIKVENESIYYGAKNGNTLSQLQRGVARTTPSAHEGGIGLKVATSFYYIDRLQDELIATQQYAAPVGAMIDYPSTTPPNGWLVRNGQAVSRSTYSALFALIGTTFGAGDGSTTFNLPNDNRRVSVGYDPSDPDFNAIGKQGGSKDAVVVLHSHGVNDPTHAHSGTTSSVDTNHYHGFSGSTSTDGNHAHSYEANLISSLNGQTHSNSRAFNNYTTNTSTNGAHAHSFSGNTGYMSGNNLHSHTFSTTGASTGISIQNAGESGVSKNLQPYTTYLKIIKH